VSHLAQVPRQQYLILQAFLASWLSLAEQERDEQEQHICLGVRPSATSLYFGWAMAGRHWKELGCLSSSDLDVFSPTVACQPGT